MNTSPQASSVAHPNAHSTLSPSYRISRVQQAKTKLNGKLTAFWKTAAGAAAIPSQLQDADVPSDASQQVLSDPTKAPAHVDKLDQPERTRLQCVSEHLRAVTKVQSTRLRPWLRALREHAVPAQHHAHPLRLGPGRQLTNNLVSSLNHTAVCLSLPNLAAADPAPPAGHVLHRAGLTLARALLECPTLSCELPKLQ